MTDRSGSSLRRGVGGWRVLVLVSSLTAGPGVIEAPAQAEPAPDGVTRASIAAGETLYHGLGGCQPCHGQGGVGTPEGPGLLAGTWRQGDGGYDWLVHMTRHGGMGMRTRSDDPRPMRGPTPLDSAQVRQVAAYVWSISRAMRPAPHPPR